MLKLMRKINPQKNKLNKNHNLSTSIAFNNKYIAQIIDQNSIELNEYINQAGRNAIRLGDGHYSRIRCLKLSNSFSKRHNYLISCSIDYIICWNIDRIIETSSNKGTIIHKNLKHEPSYCAFHPSDKYFLVCNGNILNIFEINSQTCITEIVCRDSINAAEFCLFDPDLIVFTMQNGFLSIYSFACSQQVCSIKCESSVPYVHICTSADRPLVITSTLNGFVCIYEINTLDKEPKLINHLSVEKIYLNYLIKTFSEPVDNDVTIMCLNLKLLTIDLNVSTSYDDTFVYNRFEEDDDDKQKIDKQQLIIGMATQLCIMFVDLDALQAVNIIDLRSSNSDFKMIPQAIEFCQIDNKYVNLAIASIFDNDVYAYRCLIDNNSNQNPNNSNYANDCFFLSVLPRQTLFDNSPLKSESLVDLKTFRKPLPSIQDALKKKSRPFTKGLQDKPLTFTSKIKSSGYNNPIEKKVLFQPKINKPMQRIASLGNLNLDKLTRAEINPDDRIKPDTTFDFELPNKLTRKIDITDDDKPIFCIKYSDDGRLVATAQADHIIQCFIPETLEKSQIIFRGHCDAVRLVDISHNGKYLLSISSDKTCKLWSLKKPHDILLDFPQILSISNPKLNSTVSLSKDGKTFRKDLASCNFFYVDKFVLLATENKIHLCKYFIDYVKSDVQTYIDNSTCKLVTTLEMTHAQTITCTSTINTFYSYMVFCGGSDKSLELFDLNKVQSSLVIPDAHSRAFHQICLNTTEHNQHSYDNFFTCSIGDGIKLWDLRIARCVKRFDQHITRAFPCKMSVSPCSNYIATGSEDNTIYTYDTRMNGLLNRIPGLSDTVTTVQFSPRNSEYPLHDLNQQSLTIF